MPHINRRELLAGASAAAASLTLAGCQSAPPADARAGVGAGEVTAAASGGYPPHYVAMYSAMPGEPFPVQAVNLSQINPAFLRRPVAYPTPEEPGTIVVEPHSHYLYFVEGGGRATRYGVGVGRDGFGWSGAASVNSKQEWPDWYPPKEMIERQPEIAGMVTELQGGQGMPGGLMNPLGARALYLWQDGRDTLYRIHGTFEPWTIGNSVSSGCIRMINQDAIDLYDRTSVGAKVVVLGSGGIA